VSQDYCPREKAAGTALEPHPGPRLRIHGVRVAETGQWEFRESALRWYPPQRYALGSKFDPMPCYPHDFTVAERAAAHVQECCPPLWDVDCWIADREEIARTNGHSALDDGHYEDGEWVKERRGFILLSGKRVQPHPAMTRYLIAHEYGHNVAYMINSLRDEGKHAASTEPLEREYAKVRGLPGSSVHHGQGAPGTTAARRSWPATSGCSSAAPRPSSGRTRESRAPRTSWPPGHGG
jgi:hypothetical protein